MLIKSLGKVETHTIYFPSQLPDLKESGKKIKNHILLFLHRNILTILEMALQLLS